MQGSQSRLASFVLTSIIFARRAHALLRIAAEFLAGQQLGRRRGKELREYT